MSAEQAFSIAFMPNGKPAPAVMTASEVAEFLRLDGKHPERCLKYWRDEGLLKGVRLGRRMRYRLEDVNAFLQRKAIGETGGKAERRLR